MIYTDQIFSQQQYNTKYKLLNIELWASQTLAIVILLDQSVENLECTLLYQLAGELGNAHEENEAVAE